MITKERLDSLKKNTRRKLLYVPPCPYGTCLSQILKANDVIFTACRDKNVSDNIDLKKEWFEKIKAIEGDSFEYGLYKAYARYETPYDPDALLELLCDALKTDDDTRKLAAAAIPHRHIPDPNMVE